MNLPRKTSTIFPDNQKETYGNGIENIDFTIRLSDGQALLNNTLRLTGNVQFFKNDGVPFVLEDVALYDNKLGAHALFRSMYVNTNAGTLSNINDYPTWVRLYRQRDGDRNSYCGSALRELELCLPTIRNTSAVIGTPEENGRAFAFYPLLPLNLADPDTGNMTNRSGDIRVTLSTNNVLSVLFGVDTTTLDPDTNEFTVVPNPVTTSAQYIITNLKMHYDVVGALPTDTSTTMMSIFSARHTVSTNNDTFSVNLPIVASAFVGAYKPISNMNTQTANEYAFQNPDITRLELTYNNSTNSIISFALKTQEEIILNSMSALELTSKTSMTLGQLSISRLAGRGYSDEFSIGASFGEPLDMRRARFSIRTECNGINNSARSFLDVFAVGSVAV